MTYELTPAAGGLAGKVSVGEWGSFEMSNLKAEGDTLSFSVGEAGASWTHTATLKDDELSVVITGPEGTMPALSMKRVVAIDGTWRGAIQTPDGDFPISFRLRNDAGRITGSVESQMGTSAITTGTLDGTQVRWQSEFQGMTLRYAGKLSGNTMALTITSPEWEFELMLTRVAESPAPQTP